MTKKNKKLLIVEDEDLMRKTLVERFSKEKFEIHQAEDGQKALDEALAIKPDLVLLDIVLPQLDGMVVLKKIREAGQWGKQVPIIVLTNLNADDKMICDIIESKPSYYLVKTDWTLDQIVEKVNEMLVSVEAST